MRRTVIALAAAGIAAGAAACGSSGPGGQPSGGGRAVTGTWTIASCQVDVTYVDDTKMVDHYVPDTDVNFRQHYAASTSSGAASLAVVVTFVNHTGRTAALPTGQVVSFTDRRGTRVGSPQTFNNTNGTGYGAAVANGHGSGEVFSAGTLFSPGQTVAESPDIGAVVPAQPGLSCHVRHR